MRGSIALWRECALALSLSLFKPQATATWQLWETTYVYMYCLGRFYESARSFEKLGCAGAIGRPEVNLPSTNTAPMFLSSP